LGLNLIDYLDKLDRDILLFINSKNSPFWDDFMIKVSDKFFWIFFYVLIIAFLVWKFKKQALIIIPCIVISVVISDIFASWIMKPLVGRLRPCWNEEIKGMLNLIDGCGGSFGFISSHAANHFAMSMFLVLILHKQIKWVYLLFIWAAMVSYSRIYLGAHYPGDVIGGAIAGTIIAWIIYLLYSRFIKNKFFKESIPL
jgi:undecaprenyl-diphosphatase